MNNSDNCYKYSYLLLVLVFILFTSCEFNINKKEKTDSDKNISKLEKIKKRGRLIAVTDYNSTSYFIYRGTPMGYQYDMLSMLAEHLGVDLEIIISNDLDDTFNKLVNNECDIIAMNLTVTKERSKIFNFTEPYGQTRQVLIQRKPDGWEKMSKRELEKNFIRNQLDLAHKTIYVQKGSSFFDRLQNLSDEIGDTINIIEVENYEVEQLITLVAKGEIDYSVSDENVAMLNQTYFQNIDIKTAISFSQNLAWAVNKNSPELLEELNFWISDLKRTTKYAVIYNKYFKNTKATKRKSSRYLSLSGGKISDYDNQIKKYSKLIDWDWRLLAAMIYQESRFKPKARSWAGAYGIMQLMPRTGKRFGVTKNSSTTRQIEAGAKFIKWLDNQLINKISDKDERIKFILASYNVGLGHIHDAMKLAEKNGKNPYLWENNVDYYLLNKSNPKYYRDPIVKYGYCRGQEPYDYVIDILNRYEEYQKVIKN